MLKRVENDKEVERIVDYIGNSYKTVPYLYVNILKYGKGTHSIFSYMDLNDKDGAIEGVYMLYYDCIHFFTRDADRYPIDRIIKFINQTDHKVIIVQGDVGEKIESEMGDYFSERNHVLDMDNVKQDSGKYLSEMAVSEKDIDEIVDLLIADPEYENVYEKKVLNEQMHERFNDGFSRFFVIKSDGKVVAACSTYGEAPNMAIISGVIVHPNHRRKGFASDVEYYACHVLSKENKSCIGFVNYNNTKSLSLHKKIGAISIATLAKFVRK